MSHEIPFITAAAFDDTVLKADKLVIVNFWADWCGKCKVVDPLLDEVAKEAGEKVSIVKIDLEKEPSISERFPLFHVPALLFFKKGQMCDEIIAAVPKKLLLDKIESHSY